MLTGSVAQQAVSSGAAQNGVRAGVAPDWRVPCAFQPDFKARQPAAVTYLLMNQQVHAELGQTYVQTVVRLENMQAVQKQSRWRLDFDRRRQEITLHSIKTRRGVEEFDHTDLSKARVIDQHADGSGLHDKVALVLMLEDVRPGDVLEWSYTITSRPILLPEYFSSLVTFPADAPIGKLHFAARFKTERQMQWTSSEEEWTPLETRENDQTLWHWTQEGYQGLRTEENAPAWHISFPWIQVSDCPDWGTVANAFAQAWPANENDEAITEIAGEISKTRGDIQQRIERAIQLVQDEYRDVSTPGELGGRPPSAPGVVARRRFGDGKDLSFFLMHLLRQLGAQARLVLVNSVWRKSLTELLPSPDLFDHVLVEYQIQGRKHWADATLKRTGASVSSPTIRDFGVGLPVGPGSVDLEETPLDAARPNVYELNESLLLDTSGAGSWLGVMVSASGSHADALRAEFESEGLEQVARKRLRQCADRFVNARRIGLLEFRDDRSANEFFLAEIFEINGFLSVEAKSGRYKLEIANGFMVDFLKLPDPAPRRTPFAVPYPSTVIHTIEVHAVALPPAAVQQRDTDTPYLRFSRSRKTLAGDWTVTLSLTTLADAVAPEDIEEHRDAVQEIRSQSNITVVVPMGDSRPHQRSDFGKLPASWNPSAYIPEPQDLPCKESRESRVAVATAEAAPLAPTSTRRKRRKRQRRKQQKKGMPVWQLVFVFGGLIVLALILLFVARHTGNLLPPPPDPSTTPSPT